MHAAWSSDGQQARNHTVALDASNHYLLCKFGARGCVAVEWATMERKYCIVFAGLPVLTISRSDLNSQHPVATDGSIVS